MKKLLFSIMLFSYTGIARIYASSISLGLTESTRSASPKSLLPQKNFEHFMKKYGLPSELQKDIDQGEQYSQENNDYCHHIITPTKKLFYKKTSFDRSIPLARVINSVRLKQCIERHKITTIDVPTKYIVQDKNNNFIAYSTAIDSYKEKNTFFQNLDLHVLIQDCFLFTQETGFYDWQTQNFLWRKDGETRKLVCIDTENASFSSANIQTPEEQKKDCYGSLKPFLIDILKEALNDDLYHLINTTYEHFMQKPVETYIPKSIKYDDPDINFELVKEYASQKKETI